MSYEWELVSIRVRIRVEVKVYFVGGGEVCVTWLIQQAPR